MTHMRGEKTPGAASLPNRRRFLSVSGKTVDGGDVTLPWYAHISIAGHLLRSVEAQIRELMPGLLCC